MQEPSPECRQSVLLAAAALHCSGHDRGGSASHTSVLLQMSHHGVGRVILPLNAGSFQALLGPVILPILSCQKTCCLTLHPQVLPAILIALQS